MKKYKIQYKSIYETKQVVKCYLFLFLLAFY